MPTITPAPTANGALFYRAATLRANAVDEQQRTAALTFSSEARANRWYGQEVLLHGPHNVDLSRLREMGSVLLNHNPDNIVGPIRDVQIGDDRRGHAVIAFDDDESGQTVMRKVMSGSLRGVSVGYIIHKARRLTDGEEWTDEETGTTYSGDMLIGTKWEPIEISLTPTPMDATVGVGRMESRSLDGIEIERPYRTPEESATEEGASLLDEKLRKYLEGRGLAPGADEEQAAAFLDTIASEDAERQAKPADTAQTVKESMRMASEQQRETLRAVYDRAKAADQLDMAVRMAIEGRSAEQITDALFDALVKERGTPAGPGTPEADVKSEVRDLSDEDLLAAIKNPRVVFDD